MDPVSHLAFGRHLDCPGSPRAADTRRGRRGDARRAGARCRCGGHAVRLGPLSSRARSRHALARRHAGLRLSHGTGRAVGAARDLVRPAAGGRLARNHQPRRAGPRVWRATAPRLAARRRPLDLAAGRDGRPLPPRAARRRGRPAGDCRARAAPPGCGRSARREWLSSWGSRASSPCRPSRDTSRIEAPGPPTLTRAPSRRSGAG